MSRSARVPAPLKWRTCATDDIGVRGVPSNRPLSGVQRVGAWAAAVIAVEMVLLALPLHQFAEPVRGGDAFDYLRLASNLLHHGVFSDSLRAPLDANVLRSPGYPAFLAALQAIGLGSTAALRAVQLALLGGTAFLTGMSVLRIAGERAAVIATVATATYLPLVWATTDTMTETTAALGFAGFTLLVLCARERTGSAALRAWALAGLVLALTAYVRPTALALSIPVAVAVWWDTRRFATAAVFAATVGLVVAPWAIRTSLAAHAPVALEVGTGAGRYASAEQNLGKLPIPLDGNGWLPFKQTSRRLSHDLRRGRYTPEEQAKFDRRMAHAAPAVPLRDVVRRLPARLRALWGPVDATPREEAWTTSLRWLGQLQYWLLAALVCVALVVRRRRLLRDWPLWLPALYITAVHTVIHVESRYSLPTRPGLIVLAATAAAALGRERLPRTRPLTPAEGL
jgi:hypothetical protein